MKSIEELQGFLERNSVPIILKFTARWCGPCKATKPYFDERYEELSAKYDVELVEVDIDESSNIYSRLKRLRLLSGIPTLFFYNRDNSEIYPDVFVTSGRNEKILEFFNLCEDELKKDT